MRIENLAQEASLSISLALKTCNAKLHRLMYHIGDYFHYIGCGRKEYTDVCDISHKSVKSACMSANKRREQLSLQLLRPVRVEDNIKVSLQRFKTNSVDKLNSKIQALE